LTNWLSSLICFSKIITFEPETLDSRSKAQKTRTRAWFPIRTSAKYFGLAVGPRPGDMSQNGPKTTSLLTSLLNKPQAPTEMFFQV